SERVNELLFGASLALLRKRLRGSKSRHFFPAANTSQLVFDARRHVFDRDEHTDDPIAFSKGRYRDVLLHVGEVSRRTRKRTRKEVLMKSRRKNFYDSF